LRTSSFLLCLASPVVRKVLCGNFSESKGKKLKLGDVDERVSIKALDVWCGRKDCQEAELDEVPQCALRCNKLQLEYALQVSCNKLQLEYSCNKLQLEYALSCNKLQLERALRAEPPRTGISGRASGLRQPGTGTRLGLASESR
jgi:hypothetical protein